MNIVDYIIFGFAILIVFSVAFKTKKRGMSCSSCSNCAAKQSCQKANSNTELNH